MINKLKCKVVDLNRKLKNNKLIAGLTMLDTLLLSIKVSVRVEGQMVSMTFFISKNNTLFKIKLRVTTFLKLYKKLEAIKNDILKDVK